jgi:hypothetical protein
VPTRPLTRTESIQRDTPLAVRFKTEIGYLVIIDPTISIFHMILKIGLQKPFREAMPEELTRNLIFGDSFARFFRVLR